MVEYGMFAILLYNAAFCLFILFDILLFYE